jgi:hypothetical protein
MTLSIRTDGHLIRSCGAEVCITSVDGIPIKVYGLGLTFYHYFGTI